MWKGSKKRRRPARRTASTAWAMTCTRTTHPAPRCYLPMSSRVRATAIRLLGTGDERGVDLRAAGAADADRHADLDLARPDGAVVFILHDAGADRIGGAEAVHRHREVRD